MPSYSDQTLTKTRLRTRTKIALALLSLSGIALAGALLTNQNSNAPVVADSAVAGTWTCSETDAVANFQVKGITTSIFSTTGEKRTVEDRCVPVNAPDFIWQDTKDGNIVLWMMDGTTNYELKTVGSAPGANWKVILSNDFNGDSKPDLVLQSSTDGKVAIWIMDGASYKEFKTFAAAPGASWRVVDSKDFDGDGKQDLLWQNSLDGKAVIWLLDGTVFKSLKAFTAPGANWKLIGSNDFNGDNKPDILWQDSTNGKVVVWLLDGINFIEFKTVGPLPGGTNWKVIGSDDFNGDSKPDLLWQDSSNGKVVIWMLDGYAMKELKAFANTPGANWKVIDANDFNYDRKPDLLWQNSADGKVVVWLLDGAVIKELKTFAATPGANWKLIGSNDFNDKQPALNEHFCDIFSAKGYSIRNYKCNSCDAGQCTQLRCDSDADCNDVYLYTFGTCQNNTCEFKKIEKYYDLNLKRAAGETEFSLYEGSVKNLEGTENLDEFFAKQDDGFIARYTTSTGEKIEYYRFDLMKDYVRTFRQENGGLVEDEYVRFKLPYGEDGYKAIEIYTPGKEKMVVNVDPAKLPLVVAATENQTDTKLATAPKENNEEGRVLGVGIATVVCGKIWPTTDQSQNIPSDVVFTDKTQAHTPDEMRAMFVDALKNYSPKMAELMPKKIIFDYDVNVKRLCGQDATGCYDSRQDTIRISVDDGDLDWILNYMIPHESAHAVHKSSMDQRDFYLAANGLYVSGPTMAWGQLNTSYTPDLQKNADLIDGNEWAGNNLNVSSPGKFALGCKRPYGCTELVEDIATYAEVFSKYPGAFVNYIGDRNSVYYKKLSLLKDLGIISQAQFDTLANCNCLGTDIMTVENDYYKDNDPFIKGEGDRCMNDATLGESVCENGEKNTQEIECSLGCDAANAVCRSCSTINDGLRPSFIKYYSNVESPQTRARRYESKEMPVSGCSSDAKTLYDYGCSNDIFSIPVLRLKTDCDWKCGPDRESGINQCSICETDCMGSKIGTTRNTATTGTFEKCEDPDGDGCGEWKSYSCGAGACFGDKIGTTRCNGALTLTYEKCEDANGDGCGEWKQSACPSGTYCASNQTKCGNWCDAAKETDGGVNFGKAGSVFNVVGKEFKDVCDSGTLTEYACTSGSVASQAYKCEAETPCSNGACGYRCDPAKETDGGANFEKKGRVYKYLSTTYFEDKCIDKDTLNETVCNADGRLENQEHKCGSDSICTDGRCQETYKCIDSDGGDNIKVPGYLYYYDSSGNIAREGDYYSGGLTVWRDGCFQQFSPDRVYEKWCTDKKIDPAIGMKESGATGETMYQCDCSIENIPNPYQEATDMGEYLVTGYCP